MFQAKTVEKIQIYILWSITFIFFPENRAFEETVWENTVETDRPQVTVWRLRIACWLSKATNTDSEHVLTWFSTTTMVAITRLNVTLYAHCLSLLVLLCLCENVLILRYIL